MDMLRFQPWQKGVQIFSRNALTQESGKSVKHLPDFFWIFPMPSRLRQTAIFLFTILLFNINAHAANVELRLINTNGKIVFSRMIDPFTGFAVKYTHSVAMTPVVDYFIIENGKIYLDKTVYKDFGAGLPHSPEGAQKMLLSGGNLVISGFKRPLPEFVLRVGRVAHHKLLVPDINNGWEKTDEIPLESLSQPGSSLFFSISPISKN